GVSVRFTPHLVPMNRGIFSTIYVRGLETSAEGLHAILSKSYATEPFVHVLPFGEMPQTRHVRGSNMIFIGLAKDRVGHRAIICAALDNLTKGASGQAVQNMNLMLGSRETLGLEHVALCPVREFRCARHRTRQSARLGALQCCKNLDRKPWARSLRGLPKN